MNFYEHDSSRRTEVTEVFARLNYARHSCMHDASSGLGLISLDLAGVCVVCTACDAVRGGPAVVPFVINGSQAGPMTRVGG